MPTKKKEKWDGRFDEALDEFLYQWRRFGYYDSTEDSGWRYDVDDLSIIDIVSESRWRPAWKDYVPSKCWDASLPQVVFFDYRSKEIK